MDQETMTLEQIEAHLKSANIDQYQKSGTGTQEAFDPAAALKKACGVYRGIRPVLSAVVNFPLIPGSIKAPLKTFMTVMNSLCP